MIEDYFKSIYYTIYYTIYYSIYVLSVFNPAKLFK
jgi:hypothetical protein